MPAPSVAKVRKIHLEADVVPSCDVGRYRIVASHCVVYVRTSSTVVSVESEYRLKNARKDPSLFSSVCAKDANF